MSSDEARAFWWDAYMRQWGEDKMTEPTWIEALTEREARRFCPRCHHSFNAGEAPVECPACGLQLSRLIAAAPDLLAAGFEFERLMLVIDSAVRNADPKYHEQVLAALNANRAALQKATGAA